MHINSQPICGTMLAVLLISSVAGKPIDPHRDSLFTSLAKLRDEDLARLESIFGIIDEEMMGDQPAPMNDTGVIDPIKANQERDREQRIKAIREQVLKFAGRDGKNSSLSPSVKKQKDQLSEQAKHFQYPPANIYTEKLQSFYPSCEMPRNTDEELWERSKAMNLHFELPQSESIPGSSVSVQSAKLRLFKFSQCNGTASMNINCSPTQVTTENDEKDQIRFPPIGTPINVEDKKIRVSVFWYTRSLRKHKVRRKLMDSMMLSIYGDEWTELNVKPAVKAWRESGKNFGLVVEVEDEDGNLQQTNKYFGVMNCSKNATNVQPIPGFLVDAIQNPSKTLGVYLYPAIDLSTIEFPKTEVVYHGVKYPLTDSSTHRIRHSHHRQSSTTQPNDSLEQIIWDDPTVTER